jgi:hypothetical protein
MNFNKQYEDCFIKKIKYFFEEFSKIFQEYSRKISPKVITKTVKKHVGVACVILFAPRRQTSITIETTLPPLLQ